MLCRVLGIFTWSALAFRFVRHNCMCLFVYFGPRRASQYALTCKRAVTMTVRQEFNTCVRVGETICCTSVHKASRCGGMKGVLPD
jgi:hypothetical protein